MPDRVPVTVDDLALARAALDATRGVAGVADISRGRYALARTFGLRGEMVEGVQFTASTQGLVVEIHLVVRLVPIPPLACAVREAVSAALTTLGTSVTAVDIWVDALQLTERDEARL
ncbi:MAG: hypothetical protein JWO59_2919 [Chloroflexi bacterium]|jgi:hypothetical protein|nr:hypothetical protein [Chloroflexota bacterium]